MRSTLSDAVERYLARSFDAASRRERTAGWYAPGTSANTSIAGAINILRNRSRDLCRNDPWAKRAVSVVDTNVVGSGIRAQLEDGPLEDLWRQWAETTECDADGVHDLYGLQGLIMRTVAESGECLVRLRRRRSADGLSVPIQLQVLEPDHLDASKDGAAAGGRRRVQGIEFDARGKRMGYWLFRDHPGEASVFASYESVFVPAEQVLHIFVADRPGQVRGIPWASPVIIKLRDLAGYEEAQLLRQKIAACYAVFIHDQPGMAEPDPSELKPMPSAGGGDGDSGEAEQGILGEDFVTPAMMMRLPMGKAVTFGNPPGVEGYSEFVRGHLHAVAMGFGISYEALTGDLQGVNFSSGRMGHLEFQRNVGRWQGRLMVTQFCRPIWTWFQEAADLIGAPTAAARPTWIPPRREMISPKEEIPALLQAVQMGLLSLSDAIHSTGRDPKETLEQIAADKKLVEELGVHLESILDAAPAKGAKKPGAKAKSSGDDEDEDE